MGGVRESEGEVGGVRESGRVRERWDGEASSHTHTNYPAMTDETPELS